MGVQITSGWWLRGLTWCPMNGRGVVDRMDRVVLIGLLMAGCALLGRKRVKLERRPGLARVLVGPSRRGLLFPWRNCTCASISW